MADAPQVAFGDARPEVYRRNSQPEVHQHQAAPPKQEVYPYYHDAGAGVGAYEAQAQAQAPATILGIRRRNFWILVVIAVVIVGATIGGSVGGSMAVRNSGSEREQVLQQAPTSLQATSTSASTQTQTSSPASASRSASGSATATRYAPIPASSVPLIDIACPSPDAPSLTSFNGKRYACTEGRGVVGGDITGIVAYSLQNCIDACSTMNTRGGSMKCAAVVLNADLAHSYEINNGANCWLKDKADPKMSYGPGSAGGTLAVLSG